MSSIVTIGKDEAALSKYFGGSIWGRLINADGTVPGSNADWGIFGDVKDLEPSWNTPLEDDYAADGSNHPQDGNTNNEIMVNFMDRSLNTLKFSDITMKGKYIQLLYEYSRDLIGTTSPVIQYLAVGIARVERAMKHKQPGNVIGMKFKLLENVSALTFTALSQISGARTTGIISATVTIPAHQYYEWYGIAS